jgi:hypothetical protein
MIWPGVALTINAQYKNNNNIHGELRLPLHLVSADKMGFQISLFHKIIAPGTAAVHVLLELMWCYITMYLCANTIITWA